MENERDKFLTEAMGMCWHEWEGHWTDHKTCLNCGKFNKATNSRFVNTDFSTWVGFGKLVENHDKLGITNTEISELMRSCSPYDGAFPDRFADAVYDYLMESENDN